MRTATSSSKKTDLGSQKRRSVPRDLVFKKKRTRSKAKKDLLHDPRTGKKRFEVQSVGQQPQLWSGLFQKGSGVKAPKGTSERRNAWRHQKARSDVGGEKRKKAPKTTRRLRTRKHLHCYVRAQMESSEKGGGRSALCGRAVKRLLDRTYAIAGTRSEKILDRKGSHAHFPWEGRMTETNGTK